MRGVGDADPCTDPNATFLYKFRQCAILNKKHQEEISYERERSALGVH